MKKNYAILTVFSFLFLLTNCSKDPDLNDSNTYEILDNWTITKTSYDDAISVKDMFFVNSNTGFIVSYWGKIYKTTNAGISWEQKNSGTTLNLSDVYFLDEQIGFASGPTMNCLDDDCDNGSIFLKTQDGGETWTKTFFEDYIKIQSIHFLNPLEGLALIYTSNSSMASAIPNLAKTIDGGINWTFINLPIQPFYGEFQCIDNIVFIAGENQQIFKSTDFGNTWQTIQTTIPSNNDVLKIYFYDENIGYINGISNIYQTKNGGQTWDIVDVPFTSFGVIHFYNEQEGFNIEAISEYQGGDFPTFLGSIAYETDNGKKWRTSKINENLRLGFTSFPQKDLGYGIMGKDFYTIKRK